MIVQTGFVTSAGVGAKNIGNLNFSLLHDHETAEFGVQRVNLSKRLVYHVTTTLGSKILITE